LRRDEAYGYASTMLDAFRTRLNAQKPAGLWSFISAAVILLGAAVYLVDRYFLGRRLIDMLDPSTKIWLALIAMAVAVIPALADKFRRGSEWKSGDLSPSGRLPLHAPDVIVSVVVALACVGWFLMRDVPVFNMVVPLGLLYGIPSYLGYRDTVVKPRRKGPRRSPLEQLQDWDDDGRY
jgi:hypothetical protein